MNLNYPTRRASSWLVRSSIGEVLIFSHDIQLASTSLILSPAPMNYKILDLGGQAQSHAVNVSLACHGSLMYYKIKRIESQNGITGATPLYSV
jgi:hypothetical protein